MSVETARPIRILSFGHDESLLRETDGLDEARYRQETYCRSLDLRKEFVVMTRRRVDAGRQVFSDRLAGVGAAGRYGWSQLWRASREGLRIAADFRPDLVEYQDPAQSGPAALLVARRLRVPLVGGVFNDLLDDPTWLGRSLPRRLFNRIGHYVLRRSALVRCDSKAATTSLRDRGHCNVRYVPFFVPWLERFAVPGEVADARLARWRRDPLVLCVARLAPEKNVALLLRAHSRARRECGRGRLSIVGSGPLAEPLRILAIQVGLERCVEWRGEVPYPALAPAFREANVFALSSDSETAARVLILAQAARLPTVTTATSGADEVVKEGETGYVVPIGDEGALADRLARLLGDEGTYSRLLHSDGYSVSHDHGELAIRGPLKAFYEAALSGGAGAGPR